MTPNEFELLKLCLTLAHDTLEKFQRRFVAEYGQRWIPCGTYATTTDTDDDEG